MFIVNEKTWSGVLGKDKLGPINAAAKKIAEILTESPDRARMKALEYFRTNISLY